VGTIEVILIDPTPEGQAVARAIAIRGRVTSVVSTADLHEQARRRPDGRQQKARFWTKSNR
jgi:hypothetical protein